MITPIDLLQKSQNTASVCLQKYYLLNNNTKNNDLFCFVEGKDDPSYYYPRIKQYCNYNFHFLPCGNKKNVIKLNDKLINVDSDKNRLAFFVDHDFDQDLGNNTIFETPCYSIENLYCTETVFSNILKIEFGLTEGEQIYNVVMKNYIDNQRAFHNAILSLNSWYATIIGKSRVNQVPINIPLDINIPKCLIEMQINNIQKKYNLAKLNSTYKITNLNISSHETLSMAKKLVIKNPTYSFRGKYEIDFLFIYLQHLIDDANNKLKRNLLKEKTKFRIDKALILSQLSQYAETPENLINYIQSFN